MKNRPSWALPVLLAGQDVRRMLDEEAGHRVHDPRLVRAGQREHVLLTRIRAHAATSMLLITQLTSLYATIVRHGAVSGQGREDAGVTGREDVLGSGPVQSVDR